MDAFFYTFFTNLVEHQKATLNRGRCFMISSDDKILWVLIVKIGIYLILQL